MKDGVPEGAQLQVHRNPTYRPRFRRYEFAIAFKGESGVSEGPVGLFMAYLCYLKIRLLCGGEQPRASHTSHSLYS